MPLTPEFVFDAFWETALGDAQLRENDEACMEGRDPANIEGEPAEEFAKQYREAVLKVCEEAAPLLVDKWGGVLPYGISRDGLDTAFGSDLYLTAVGHGAGFWDGDWGSIGDDLTEITKRHMPSGDLAEHKDGGFFFI